MYITKVLERPWSIRCFKIKILERYVFKMPDYLLLTGSTSTVGGAHLYLSPIQ